MEAEGSILEIEGNRLEEGSDSCIQIRSLGICMGCNDKTENKNGQK